MRSVLLLASMLLAVGACTDYRQHWARPGGTEADLAAATTTCEEAALVRFPPVTLGAPGYFSTPDTYCTPTAGGTNCSIISSGYLPQARAAVDNNGGLRESAFRACLMVAGWRPVSGPAEGEAVTLSAPPAQAVSEAAVGKALTYCESLFKGQRNTEVSSAKFDQCVMSRARELNGTRPPA